MAPPDRILVAEDEPDIAGLIKHALERDGGATVSVVGTGDAALRAGPATRQLPIIMLTARTSESDRIAGLDLGADDYVTKPFSIRELAARVRAVLRRRQQGPDVAVAALYRGRHLRADFDAVAIEVDGKPVRLTKREFELLRFLVENRNRVLSRDRLLQRVWGYEQFIETRSIDVHVGRLRSKLGIAGSQIETVIGLGYRFVELA